VFVRGEAGPASSREPERSRRAAADPGQSDPGIRRACRPGRNGPQFLRLRCLHPPSTLSTLRVPASRSRERIMCGNRLNDWKTMPIPAPDLVHVYARGGEISSPSMQMRPASIGSSRFTQRSKRRLARNRTNRSGRRPRVRRRQVKAAQDMQIPERLPEPATSRPARPQYFAHWAFRRNGADRGPRASR